MNLKIYTMTHKQFIPPNDQIYVPLQVGRAVNPPLGYIGDDTGDNISDLNELYGELTGVYWVWQNDHDSDAVGICHYRRYFFDDDGKLMSQPQYEELLKKYDVITSEEISLGGSNYENFTKTHGANNLDAVGKALKRLYPMDYWAYEKVMEEESSCYGNLMVIDKEKYNEYCEWMFTIILEAQPDINIEGFDLYHRRVFGFISELLLSVWITARNYKPYRCKVGITAEKAETIELRETMAYLVEKRDIKKAKELFYDYLKIRPDIILQDGLAKEFSIIEKLLYIMYLEDRAGIVGLLDFSNNLKILQEHYKLSALQIKMMLRKDESLKKKNTNQWNKLLSETEYFKEMPLSMIGLDVILKDLSGRLSFYDYLNDGKTRKKVSVIVPVYNGVGQFDGAIGNLVHQTLEEIEIIFIDDCSTDESYQILKQCERQYPEKVRVLQTPENLRAGGARNVGLEIAAGEYIGFVDCDDLPDVQMYEKLYQRAKEGNYEMVDGGFVYDGREAIVLYTTDEDTGRLNNKQRETLIQRGGYLWSKLIKKELIDRNHLRFREKVPMLEDADFLDVLFLDVKNMGNLKEIIYRYHNTEGSLSKDLRRDTYFLCLYEGIRGIFEKTHKMKRYKAVKEALEYEMIQLYLCAVAACMESWMAKEDYPVLETLKKFRILRKKVAPLGYSNKYAQKVLHTMDLAIMEMNDTDPEQLLKTSEVINWEFDHKRV